MFTVYDGRRRWRERQRGRMGRRGRKDVPGPVMVGDIFCHAVQNTTHLGIPMYTFREPYVQQGKRYCFGKSFFMFEVTQAMDPKRVISSRTQGNFYISVCPSISLCHPCKVSLGLLRLPEALIGYLKPLDAP